MEVSSSLGIRKLQRNFDGRLSVQPRTALSVDLRCCRSRFPPSMHHLGLRACYRYSRQVETLQKRKGLLTPSSGGIFNYFSTFLIYFLPFPYFFWGFPAELNCVCISVRCTILAESVETLSSVSKLGQRRDLFVRLKQSCQNSESISKNRVLT